MLQNSRLQKTLSAKRRYPLARWPGLIVVLLLALIFGSVGQPAPARAAPEAEWESYSIMLNYHSPVCVGEKMSIEVFLKKTVYRLFGGIGGSSTYPTGQLIGAEGNNAQAGSINSSGVTGQGDPTLNPNTHAVFIFTANKKGTTKITFSDLGPFSSRAPARSSRASEREITIEVKECEYQLVAFSDWVHPKGFQPHMNSVIDAVIKLDQNLHVIPVFPKVENVARPQVPFVCTHILTANETEVQITGRLDTADGKLHLTLDYGVVTAGSTMTCPAAGATSVGKGEPITFITQPLRASLSAGGGGQAYPHILHTDVDVSGTTAIIIVPIYLP